MPLIFSILIATCIVLLICFPLHELGHALAADRLGDDTPRRYGRITLNPIKHLDAWGSIMFLLLGFGWATTPVNYGNLRGSPSISRALVAIAGPLMNLLLAVIAALVFRAINDNVSMARAYGMGAAAVGAELINNILLQLVSINLLLFCFNLMPIPPLDGWSIFRGFLPPNIVDMIEQFGQFLFLIFWVTPILNYTVMPLTVALQRLLLGY